MASKTPESGSCVHNVTKKHGAIVRFKYLKMDKGL